ncbi:MAG: hypothetical protein ACD_48C00379G0001 [uncultured bacterium]|nr:MAG: hypothetical protein ACD_48C00379G0001 [uncultured bacterium]
MGQEGTIGVIDKERSLTKGNVTLRGINLDVQGKIIVVPDDFVSTGGTLIDVAALLKRGGAKKIIACISHALLSKDAAKKIADSDIDEFVTTDTVMIEELKRKQLGAKLTVIPVGELIRSYVKK